MYKGNGDIWGGGAADQQYFMQNHELNIDY